MRDALIRDFPEEETGIGAFFRDAAALGVRLRILDKKTMGRETMVWHEKLVRGLGMLCWSLPVIRYVPTPVDTGLRRYFRSAGSQAIKRDGGQHEKARRLLIGLVGSPRGLRQLG